MAAVSADGNTVCVLIRRLNSSCSRSMALVVRTLRHWLGGNRVKVNNRSPASCRLSVTARCLSRPGAVGRWREGHARGRGDGVREETGGGSDPPSRPLTSQPIELKDEHRQKKAPDAMPGQ
jgi:hypothetical protein